MGLSGERCIHLFPLEVSLGHWSIFSRNPEVLHSVNIGVIRGMTRNTEIFGLKISKIDLVGVFHTYPLQTSHTLS